MTLRLTTSIALLSVVLGACYAPARDLTETEKTAIADSVENVLQDFWDAWSGIDFDSAMSFYLDSPELVFSWGAGRMLVGYDAVFDTWQPMFEDIESQEVVMDSTHINVLARDAVSVSQRGSYSMLFANGEKSEAMTFAFTTVWIRYDGRWQVVAGHQSDTDAAS